MTSQPLFQLKPPREEITLASRSPQRRALLAQLVPEIAIQVVPPRNPHERSLASCRSRAEIAAGLVTIAEEKAADVLAQLPEPNKACVLAADTIIAVGSDDSGWHALGKPPEDDWQNTTVCWFREHFAGKTHLAMTGLCLITGGATRSRVVTTEVTFRPDIESFLKNYIASGEPRGKAGGYGLQSLGSLFVQRIAGSPTNVIGLPLAELSELLLELEIVR